MNLLNATLLDMTGAGSPDRSGDVTNEGAAVWSGRARGYLRRERRRAVTGGGMTLIEGDTLFVPTPARALLAAVPGDQSTGTTVLVEDHRGPTAVTRRFRVVGVQHSAAGTPVDSLRLELDDARVDA